MNKRVKRLLSLVLCLLMFVSVAQPAFAVGTIAPVDDGMDREIGEDEVRPFGDLVIDEEAEEALLRYFTDVQAVRASTAGNGRLVRNKVEEAILNQSRRIVAEPEADLELLVRGDFELDDILG